MKQTTPRKKAKTPARKPVPRKPAPKANVRKAQKALRKFTVKPESAEVAASSTAQARVEHADPSPPAAPPNGIHAETVSHETMLATEDGSLPLFMHWTVTERQTGSTSSTARTRHFADLLFGEKVTHTLEGPMAKKMLQEHADHYNKIRYMPNFDLIKRAAPRPSRDHFLDGGKAEKPFVT